jgi:uncharacterized lipoprotein YbaY
MCGMTRGVRVGLLTAALAGGMMVVAPGCHQSTPAPEPLPLEPLDRGELIGQAKVQEPTAARLPRDTNLWVWLERSDDDRERAIGRAVVAAADRALIPFAIEYLQQNIVPEGTYELRAQLRAGSRILASHTQALELDEDGVLPPQVTFELDPTP